jgi:GTP pyrophosphokinase
MSVFTPAVDVREDDKGVIVKAEHGAAAHWLYKGKASAVEKDPVEDQWVKGLVRQHEQAKSAEGFIETLHRQV